MPILTHTNYNVLLELLCRLGPRAQLFKQPYANRSGPDIDRGPIFTVVDNHSRLGNSNIEAERKFFPYAIPAPLLDVMAPYTPRASGFWADATMTSTYYSDEDEDLEQQDQLIGEDSDGRTPVCSGC